MDRHKYVVVRRLEVANRGNGIQTLLITEHSGAAFYERLSKLVQPGDVVRLSVAVRRTDEDDSEFDDSRDVIGLWNTVSYGPNPKTNLFEDLTVTAFNPTTFRDGDDKYERCDTCSEYKIMPHQINTCFDCVYKETLNETGNALNKVFDYFDKK